MTAPSPSSNFSISGLTYTTHGVQLDVDWEASLVGLYFYVLHESKEAEADANADEDEKVVHISCRHMGRIEDPATGSAASALASYLALESVGTEGDTGEYGLAFALTQGREMGRKSYIRIEVVVGLGEEEQGLRVREVLLSGTARRIMEGRFA